MYILEAANGPLDGKRWEFSSSIEIGRDAALVQAALPLDAAVSRKHARIEVTDGKLLVRDLQSSNGTLLRGEAIASAGELQCGECFVVGRTMLRVLAAARR